MSKIYTAKELNIRYQELVDNPSTRVPICLCVDTSNSMNNNHRIDRLNEGIRAFMETLSNDDIARDSAELCIISFGNGGTRLICDYNTIDNIEPPNLVASGKTPMGEAVFMALEQLRIRKDEYNSAGIDYYQPWLVVISDGEATDIDLVGRASVEVQKLINTRKLHTVPVGIDTNGDALAKFSKDKVYKLDELKFAEFFAWLSKSISRVSMSLSGEDPKIEPTNTWEKMFF
ncbi:VWA domain-containing protein [Bacillota bacterium]